MALMCPAKGCKEHKGICKHEKMMLGIIVIVIATVIILRLI